MTEQSAHIVVVDDDDDIRSSLAKYLRRHGFRVSVAANGDELNQVLSTANADLLVLDIMLPGDDGLTICRRVLETRQLPIIFLTALAEDIDRILGLELGADDYVTKPFNPRELLARIKSVMRRSQMLPNKPRIAKGVVKFDRWQFDISRKEIMGADNVAIRLSSGEHLVLVSLIEHAGSTLTRDQLLNLTKGREAQLFDRSIDNVISRLRRKLETDPKKPLIIQTQWGNGYAFVADLESAS
jgi:two-component system OmpR family response regulator